MNLFKREIKDNRKSLIIWSITIILILYGSMIKYKGFENSGEDLFKLMDSLPTILKAMFGMGNLDVTKIDGFYSVMYSLTAVALMFHALILGSSILIKEERDNTSEFLYVKPITRNKIITIKYLSAMFNILILNIVVSISSFLIVNTYGNMNLNKELTILMIALFIIQLLFLSISFMISTLVKKVKLSSSISMFIGVFVYITSILVSISDKLNFLRYLSPIKYFDSELIFLGHNIEYRFIIISFIFIIISLVISYKKYNKKDLSI